MSVIKVLIVPTLIAVQILSANDINDFPEDEGSNLLNMRSITETQTTDAYIDTKAQVPKSRKQLSLLKRSNMQRNGMYAMLSFNTVPVDRLVNSQDLISKYTFGLGIRGGMISYIDDHIGIRGYLAFDFTSDYLSSPKESSHTGNFIMLSLGLDLLVDFFLDKNYKNTLGFFVGIGAGYLTYFDRNNTIINNDKNRVITGNVMVQTGVTTTFFYKHRVECGIRFLPTQNFILSTDGITADFNVYAGYSYTF